MTPLIDVVFLLLTFFLFSLVLMVRADTLDVQLPSLTAGGPARTGGVITIALTQTGQIALDGEPINPDTLADAITSARAARPDAKLVIAADQNGRSGELLGLIDRLTAAGITEFGVLSQRDTPAGTAPEEGGLP